MMFAANSLLFHVVILEEKIQESFISTTIAVLGYVHSTMSLLITILITVDRLLAVKYSLRYNLFMTKKLINIIVVIATGCNTLLYIILYTFDEELLFVWPSTMGTMVFANGMRLITMLTIVIIGRITLNIRSKAEKAINRQIDMIHGQRAERLTVLRTLKRSVKDVNFET